jgi:hypothetical protein
MPERLNSLFFWVPSTLLGRSSVGARVRLRNGATILHSSWPITLTAMVLHDGSVVHGGPTRWVRCTRWPYTMGPLYTVAPSVRARGWFRSRAACGLVCVCVREEGECGFLCGLVCGLVCVG